MSGRIHLERNQAGKIIAIHLRNSRGTIVERKEIKAEPGSEEYLSELGGAVRDIGRGKSVRK